MPVVPPAAANALPIPVADLVRATPIPASAAASPQTVLIRLQGSWEEVVRAALHERYVELAAGLTDSAPIAFSGDALTVAVSTAFHLRAATQHDLVTQFESVLAVVAQRTIRVILKGREAGDRSQRYRAAQEHPLTRLLISRFDADIVARELVDPTTPGPAQPS